MKHKKRNKNLLRNFIISFFVLFSIFFMSVGYAALNTTLTISGEAVVLKTDSLKITKIEDNELLNGGFSLYNPSFTEDTTEMHVSLPNQNSTVSYNVTLSNTTNMDYVLSNIFEEVNSNSDIKYVIEGIAINGIIKAGEEIVFQIKFYYEGAIPPATDISLNLKYEFLTETEIFTDPILNGADPVLADGMIPIIYNETTNTWEKAPITDEWYNYVNTKWANVATVVESKRNYYLTAPIGTEVSMDDITVMLVWIPRFSYTLLEQFGEIGTGASTPSLSTPGGFNIKFIGTSQTDLGTAKYTSGAPSNYHTSPSFCWGNTCDNPDTRSDSENVEVPGFWIAKFEASKVGNLLYSKPNMLPMNQITISSTFYMVQSLMNGQTGQNNYGYIDNVDAHLIKNTEWGAMAYLSQSKYGKYGNPDYTGANKEIYPNNCINYSTGIGGDSPHSLKTTATCGVNTYDTYNGMGASTTGNIYGVYDTVGGTFDRVMGSVLSETGDFYPDASGFTSLPEAKYINVYPYGNYGVNTTPSIKGDALTDTLGFYSDRGVAGFYLQYHWFYRGGSLWGNDPVVNGIFSYTTYSGAADPNHSSRFTLTVP